MNCSLIYHLTMQPESISEKSLTLVIANYADRNISISRQHEETLVVRNGGQVERIDTSDFVDRQFQEYSR